MEWMAEVSKEEVERMLTERQREFEKDFKMNLEAIRVGGENERARIHQADNSHISDVVFTTMGNRGKCLQKINEAWQRIKNNTFGICLTCGEPIPEKQLQVTPERGSCVSCKNSKKK